MLSILKFYRWLNILSIDVAIGAIVCGYFFSRIAEVTLRPAGLATLGLSVWIIYTTDHLVDALSLKGLASTARHRYHQLHFWELIIAEMLALVAVGILLFFIRPEVFLGGAVLLALVGIYMLVNRYLNYLKEIMVAVLYCAGILLPSGMRVEDPMAFLIRPETTMLFLVALLNLLIFSWFEIETDREDGYPSFAGHFGARPTRKVIMILFIVQFLIPLVSWIAGVFSSYQLILLSMTLVLGIIFLLPEYFGKSDRYRLLGDAIFLLPVLFFLLP